MLCPYSTPNRGLSNNFQLAALFAALFVLLRASGMGGAGSVIR